MKDTSGPPIRVTIDVSSPTATNAVQSAAYLDRFDLGDVSANRSQSRFELKMRPDSRYYSA